MSRRRRHRKRWSVYDFDNYISRKVGNGYLELKRLLLRAPHLVKVLRGRGRWIHPAKLDPSESVVGFYPASAKPRADERQFEPYRRMLVEQAAKPKPEPVPEPVPENKKLLPFLRRPPLRHLRRSTSRRSAPDSHAA